MELYTVHLFAGAGGGILADILLGHKTIGAVEIEPYCREVLLNRQLEGLLPEFPIWDDVKTFRQDNPNTSEYISRLQGIREKLCISGGFPCQDISSAGKGAGIKGERSGLWKEFARIIGEVRPKYIFLENSPLLIRRGLDVVLTDIAKMGYTFAWGIVSAADVGAPHLRKRFWGVGKISDSLCDRERRIGSSQEVATDRADGTSADSEGRRLETTGCGSCIEERFVRSSNVCDSISDANGTRQQTIDTEGDKEGSLFRLGEIHSSVSDTLQSGILGGKRSLSEDSVDKGLDGRGETLDDFRERRETESELGGMVDGLDTWLDENQLGTLWLPDEKGIPRLAPACKDRTKRLKSIGNGQVPLCAANAWLILKDIVDNCCS